MNVGQLTSTTGLEAVEITFADPVEDQVCLPDDYRDFFFFELPPGYNPSGEISLYCDAEPTTLGLYDDSQTWQAIP